MGQITNGLHIKRPRTCPCGVVFEARKPAATYCGNDCRRRFTGYGRTYGQVAPRQFGVWRKG